MLTLPIKKKWFDMILSGEKKEEYRDFTDYWDKRIRSVWGYPVYWTEPHQVRLRNGYSNKSPSMIATCTVSFGAGLPEWGATPGRPYFILHIISVAEEKMDL